MLNRILITGAAGSGKSTLAAGLAEALGCRWSDTDDFYWLPTATPFERKRDREEQFRLLTGTLSQDGVQIVAGSFSGWGARILPFADAVVWIVAPTSLRLKRIRERQRERFGKAILPRGTMHATHENLLREAASYDDEHGPGRSLARDAAWFEGLRCPSIRIDGTAPLEDQLSAVRSWLAAIGPPKENESQ